MSSKETGSVTARRLGAQTLYVLFGNFFTLAVGWPLQIYVARTLGAVGLGTFGLLDAGASTISGFLNLGLTQTVIRHIPAHLERGEHGDIRHLLRISLRVLLAMGAIAYLVLLAGINGIEMLWPALARFRIELVVMGLMIPLSLLSSFLLQSLRGMQEIRYMVLGTSVIQLIVKVALTIVLFMLGWNLLGYVLATVLATFVGIAWMGYGLAAKLAEMPAGNAVQSAPSAWWRYAAVTYSASILLGAMANVDRFALGFFAGSGAVGIFMAARQLQQLPAMFNQMMLMVGAPMLSVAHSRDDGAGRQHLYGLMTDWVVRASLPLILFLALFGRPLLALNGERFAVEGLLALRILVAAQFFSIACGPVGNVALLSGLENITLRLTVISACLETGLLVLLVPVFGLTGAAAASAAGTILINIAITLVVRNRLRLIWWDPRFARWLGPGAAALLIGVGIDIAGVAMGPTVLIVTLIAMYLSFVVVSVLQGLHEDDRDLLEHIRSRLFSQQLPG